MRRRSARQRHAVGEYAVSADVLAGDHGRARGHADGVLIVGAAIIEAGGGERIGDRCARDTPAVASERVVTLLVGGDEKNLAAHRGCPGQITVTVQIRSTAEKIARAGLYRALAQAC